MKRAKERARKEKRARKEQEMRKENKKRKKDKNSKTSKKRLRVVCNDRGECFNGGGAAFYGDALWWRFYTGNGNRRRLKAASPAIEGGSVFQWHRAA